MRFTRSFFVLAVLYSGFAFAQTDRSTITGTVSDPAAAVVPNASIEIKNVETGATYQTATTATGNYTLAQLPTGTYEMSVAVPGFKRFVRQNLFLSVATTVRVDVLLEVGQATESVTVSDAASLLKTESGELSHNINMSQMNTLPMLRTGANIRSPYAVATVLPGMAWTGGSFQSMRVNGQPSNTQAFRVDGQDSTNGLWQIQASMVQPSVDAIQEVAIQTSNFAAEFGQAGGGVFNLTMRSGTNKLHGSGYDYITNEALNAGLAFTSNVAGGKPNEHIRNRGRQHDYGFSVGGPVFIPKIYNGKDKTFFFGNFEQWRNVVYTSNGIQSVPTDAMRAGNFSNQGLSVIRTIYSDPTGVRPTVLEGQIFDPLTERPGADRIRDPFVNSTIPTTRIDPVAAKIQALLPKLNSADPNLVFRNYAVPTYGVPNVQTIPSVKIDHNLSSTIKLSGYWSTSRVDNPGGDGFADPITSRTISRDRTHTIRVNFDQTLTPTLLLHLGVGMVHLNSFQGGPEFHPLAELGLKGLNTDGYFPYLSGLFSAGSNNRGGYSNAAGPQLLRTFKNEKPTANASLTWVRNNHTYKIGAEMIIEGYPASVESFANGNFAFSDQTTSQPFLSTLAGLVANPGHSYASFLLGGVNSGSIAAVANSRLGNHAFGLFVQDTWKVTRKLTLDYGLRWDYVTYLKEQYGRVPAFSPEVFNSSLGYKGGVAFEGFGVPGRCNCNIANNYPYAIGPRLGAAYQINSKTVIRAGFGITYGKAPEFGWLGGSINGLVNFSTPVPYNPQFNLRDGNNVPTSYPNLNPTSFPSTPAQRNAPIYNIDQNAGRPSRTMQWSIGLQREVIRNLVVEATYVANRGVWQQSNISQINAITLDRLKQFGFDITNANDRNVLGSFVNVANPALNDPRVKIPYAGFPATRVYETLRPYPQFGSNLQQLWSPTGKSWYDSLQAKVTKRLSHGLDIQGAFTWQKELQISAENSYALFGFPTPANDVKNYNLNKYLSGQSRPLQLVIAASYVTPKWKANRVVGFITGDWQIAALMRYQSGALIQIPGTNNNLNNQIGRGGNLAQRVPGKPLFLQDLNCKCFDPNKDLVVNLAAWEQTPAGQFSNSTAYYNDLRGPRFPSESMNLGRNFRFGPEGMVFQVRAEFANIFNRRATPTPGISNLTAQTQRDAAGTLLGGFGFTNTAGGAGQQPRSGTIVARITF